MSLGRHWKTLCAIPRYSFLKGTNENVRRVEDRSGNWIEGHLAQEIVDNAESDIYQLRSALSAMVTYFGMDEDEWSKPVFDKAREALEETK